MRKVIIDTDPGIDDAVAILYAFRRPEWEVLGLCSVAGNKPIAMTTRNALRLSALAGKRTPVYQGADRSWKAIHEGLPERHDQTDEIHGSDGMGNVDLPADETLLQPTSAVDFILDTVREHPGEIEIIALGPLTNLALCVEKEPETMKRVKALYSMGGAVHRGNMTPVSEFNYWFDPESVNVVFEGMGHDVPITMVGLDATEQGLLDMNDLTFMRFAGGKLGAFLYDMVDVYIQQAWTANRRLGVVIHDLMVPVGAADPEIYRSAPAGYLQCETQSPLSLGQCVVDFSPGAAAKRNVVIPLVIDGDRFRHEVMETLFGGETAALYEETRRK